jgi:hypothetical protein
VVGLCKQGNGPKGSKKYRTLTTKYQLLQIDSYMVLSYLLNELLCIIQLNYSFQRATLHFSIQCINILNV